MYSCIYYLNMLWNINVRIMKIKKINVVNHFQKKGSFSIRPHLYVLFQNVFLGESKLIIPMVFDYINNLLVLFR